jgi:hypothetical protein
LRILLTRALEKGNQQDKHFHHRQILNIEIGGKRNTQAKQKTEDGQNTGVQAHSGASEDDGLGG